MKTLLPLAVLAGCQFSSPMTPSAAEQGTYELFVDDSQGTGWAIDEHHLVTAGHMCTDGVGSKLAARTSTGFQFQTEVVDYEMDGYEDEKTPLKDACLLYSERPLAAPLPLAAEMPAVGTEAWFVGYPLGTYVKSVGTYLGDTDGVQKWNDYTVSAPCDHGASGSAFFTDEGVFGVLVRVLVVGVDVRPGTDGCAATPLVDIKALLKRNGLPTE